MKAIGIFRLTRQFTMYRWLCADCLAMRTRPEAEDGSSIFSGDRGWTAEKIGETTGECSDCDFAKQVKHAEQVGKGPWGPEVRPVPPRPDVQAGKANDGAKRRRGRRPGATQKKTAQGSARLSARVEASGVLPGVSQANQAAGVSAGVGEAGVGTPLGCSLTDEDK